MFPPPDSDLGRLVREAGLETVMIPGAGMAASLNGRVVVGGPPESYPARVRTTLRGRASFATAGLKIRRAVREYSALAPPATRRHAGRRTPAPARLSR